MKLNKIASLIIILAFVLSILAFAPKSVSAITCSVEPYCDNWGWNGATRCYGNYIEECFYNEDCGAMQPEGHYDIIKNCGDCGCSQSGTSAWCTHSGFESYCDNSGWDGAKKCVGNDIYICKFEEGICGYYDFYQSCPTGCTEWWTGINTDAACISCTDECSPSGALRCLDSTTKQTCGNYDADACLEWGNNVYCEYGCSGGSCINPGAYRCVDGPADCTLSSTFAGACRQSACGGIAALWCAIDERCKKFIDCNFELEGVKICYDCIYDSSCCYEGAVASSTDECKVCNSNWYLTSGRCCLKGYYWDGSACIAGTDACTDGTYNVFNTPTWYYYGYVEYYGKTDNYACCSGVSRYGETSNYFVTIGVY